MQCVRVNSHKRGFPNGTQLQLRPMHADAGRQATADSEHVHRLVSVRAFRGRNVHAVSIFTLHTLTVEQGARVTCARLNSHSKRRVLTRN